MILVFVTDDLALVGDRDRYFSRIIQNDTLASEAALEPWIDGPVDEILLFFRDFLQIILTAFDIYMTGGTRTNASAVVVQVNAVVFGDFQDGLLLKIARHGFPGNGFIFKLKFYCNHGGKVINMGKGSMKIIAGEVF